MSGKTPAAVKTPAAGKTAEKAPAKDVAREKAPEVNPDRQIVPQGKSGMAATATGIQTTGAHWGFAPLKTLSGRSLGSLEHLHMDWNAADTSEVSSRSPASQISDHPVGPSLVTHKMFTAKAALLEADRAAEVNIAD